MSKDKCSFCRTEDEDLEYFASNDGAACICEKCASLFVNYLSLKKSSTTSDDQNVVVCIKNYFVIRIGLINSSSEGDFIDNILPDLSLVVITDDDENLIVHHQSLGYLIYKNQLFSDIIRDVVAKLSSSIDPDLLAGLYVSIFEQDPDGLINVSDEFEDKIFNADETEEVGGYTNSVFGIGSVSRDSGATISLPSGKVNFEGEELDNSSAFYGYVDEDETWVIGVKTA